MKTITKNFCLIIICAIMLVATGLTLAGCGRDYDVMSHPQTEGDFVLTISADNSTPIQGAGIMITAILENFSGYSHYLLHGNFIFGTHIYPRSGGGGKSYPNSGIGTSFIDKDGVVEKTFATARDLSRGIYLLRASANFHIQIGDGFKEFLIWSNIIEITVI